MRGHIWLLEARIQAEKPLSDCLSPAQVSRNWLLGGDEHVLLCQLTSSLVVGHNRMTTGAANGTPKGGVPAPVFLFRDPSNRRPFIPVHWAIICWSPTFSMA